MIDGGFGPARPVAPDRGPRGTASRNFARVPAIRNDGCGVNLPAPGNAVAMVSGCVDAGVAACDAATPPFCTTVVCGAARLVVCAAVLSGADSLADT